MTSRRGHATHVRPRPPSTGRPLQAVRAPAPSIQRVRRHRGIEPRRQRLPWSTRALLTLSVVLLGAIVFLSAGGAAGAIVASLGSTINTAFGKLAETPAASASLAPVPGAPQIAPASNPATNQPSAVLQITIPIEIVGTDARVRVYVTLAGLTPAAVTEVPVGSTSQLQIPVRLTKGTNDFTATIIRDGVESAPSNDVTIVLDQNAPKLTITSPKDGATVNGSIVTITGTTQAQSQLVAHDAANGQSVKGVAGADGKFSLKLTIDQGANAIDVTSTDPAGNAATAQFTVTQGTGKMKADLTASLYRISLKHPPRSLQLQVTVSDPGGNPLAGASAFFTLQIPGLAPISSTILTDANGRAIFTTQLVGPMTQGTGLATVLVTDTPYGSTSDRVNLNFVKN